MAKVIDNHSPQQAWREKYQSNKPLWVCSSRHLAKPIDGLQAVESLYGRTLQGAFLEEARCSTFRTDRTI
ncbi:hypothetical protein TNCV_1714591 [Trichonephila clavipes]|nr:hypothetical protein TNCV_1714591 [Trichonephila clavipes]